MLLWQEYINYQEEFTKKYGDNTICLMQVGKFYELYSLDNTGYIKDISDILNIVLSRKNKTAENISQSNPYMAGIPCDRLDKYLPPLIDANYTVIIIDQTDEKISLKSNREFDRKVSRIVSKSTIFNTMNNIVKPDANNIVSIYIEEIANITYIGFALLDVSTGKTSIHQINSKTHDIYEEIYRFIETNNPLEIVINVNKINLSKEEVYQYINIQNRLMHFSNTVQSDVFKVSFQNTLLKKVYQPQSYLSPIEYLNLEHKTEARNAFILLLQFAYEHDEMNIMKLQIPEHYQENKYLIIYNNALEQLDITPKNKGKSVFNIINKTRTPMGRRELYFRLTNPITDITELTNRYKLVEQITPHIKQIEIFLDSLVDIERFNRKLLLKTIHPHELARLIESYDTILSMILYLRKNNTTKSDMEKEVLQKMMNEIKNKLNLEEMMKYNRDDIKTNIFKNGINPDIDDIQKILDESNKFLTDKVDEFNNIVVKNIKPTKSAKKNDEDEKQYVYLEYSDKPPCGYFITCTKTRADIIKKNYECNIEQYRATDYKIVSQIIQEHSDKLVKYTSQISTLLTKKYIELLEHINKNYQLKSILDLVNYIDVAISSAKCAIEYKYCCPIISTPNTSSNTSTNQSPIPDTSNKNLASRIAAKNLRHPIVERINDNINYVANDIKLNTDEMGILLYGVNACGKSTYMKSVGISIILAQMGMYVPAETFEYYPYSHLFTRITGEDNLHTGHSSFAVEMSELRSILKFANNKSIVLGDEICKGTETTSGIAIVASAVRRFSKNGIAFIFATHLHKLSEMNCITDLTNIKLYHLEVSNDNGVLIYNRKLKEGAGNAIYGLEVAKCMIPDKEFIEDAVKIRRELMQQSNEIVSTDKSKYNADIYVDKCQITECNSDKTEQLDVHHIKFQSHCDETGFVGHIKKNVKSNLVVLCKTHHNEVHNGMLNINGYTETSNGIILDYNHITKEEENEKKKQRLKYSSDDIKIIIKHKDKPIAKAIIDLKKEGYNIGKDTLKKIFDGNYL